MALTVPVPEALDTPRFEHPEGIVWDAREHRLLWVDVFRGLLCSSDRDGGDLRSLDLGRPLGSVAPRRGGGFVCAVREGFGLLSPEGGLELIAAPLRDRPELQMNDGGVDAWGRFWSGPVTLVEDLRGAGSLYRLDASHAACPVLDGVTVSNGIGWSPDSTRLYFCDSPTRRIDCFEFDLEEGRLGKRTALATVEAQPDGLALDTDGCVWVALFGGHRVIRVTPDGRVDREVELPGSQVTTCTFGGPDLRTLYIAVSPYGLDRDDPDAEGAGLIYAFEPGVQGMPTDEYAG
jgi:sugar lactone lactonase YvrE